MVLGMRWALRPLGSALMVTLKERSEQLGVREKAVNQQNIQKGSRVGW